MKPFQQEFKEFMFRLLVNLQYLLGLLQLFLIVPWVEYKLNRICQNFHQTLTQQVCLTIEETQQAANITVYSFWGEF